MVVPDVYVLGPVMEYLINRDFNATLVITMYHSRIHLRTKQTNQDLSHLDGLTCNFTCFHALCLGWTECHRSLLPVVPRNSFRSYAKDPS